MEKGRKKRLIIAGSVLAVVILAAAAVTYRMFNGALSGTFTDEKTVLLGDTFEAYPQIPTREAQYDTNYLQFVQNEWRGEDIGYFSPGRFLVGIYKSLKTTDQPTEMSKPNMLNSQIRDIMRITIKEKPKPVDMTVQSGQDFEIETNWINGNIATQRRFEKTPPQYDASIIQYNGYTQDKRKNPGAGPSWQFKAHHKFTVLKATDAWGTDITWEWRSIHLVAN